MQACRSCHTNVGSLAEKCPSCGQPTRNKLAADLVVYVAGFAFFFVMLHLYMTG